MARAGVPILGYVPAMPEVTLPSRHLGLVLADELRDELDAVLRTLGERLAAHVDVERILTLARSAEPLPEIAPRPAPPCRELRIAVARDEAFAFYYPENIELLEEAGAEIRYFSPLTDTPLPEVDGLYLGGGYPELHAERLAANTSMRRSIAAAIAGGLPTYAECGGLMYLCASLTDLAGVCRPMVAAVPAQASMQQRLQRIGYYLGVLQADSILGAAGTPLRGHAFHYSSCVYERTQTAYLLNGQVEGYCRGNLLASYLHLHFAGCPQVVEHWLRRCRHYAQTRSNDAEP
jgi:cobyrinic acid a,c-diamide synthase